MKVILVFPETKAGVEELQKRVSVVHASAIGTYLKNLDCPLEQKLELIRTVQDSDKRNEG